jgi:sugar/nucleoside kinase (ribokinase family)
MSTCSPTKDDIEAACIALAAMRPKQAVVIRAGALGACYTLTSTPGEVSWVPAFWGPSDGGKVVDVTGAGNSFLGGLCAGLDEGLDVRQCKRYYSQ